MGIQGIVRGLLVLQLWILLPGQLSAESPWTLLEQLRNSLQGAGPQTAKFVQTYIPAGFSSGDQESGQLSLWLPDCLRWNYVEPQSKNFLVCEGEVYYWTDEEPGGRHSKVKPEDEPGLDLLLLTVSRLRERYVAESATVHGQDEIHLSLPPDQPGAFSARIRLDASGRRVAGLEYTDAEGNRTHFEIRDYQTLSHTALFQPPSDIQWTEE